MIGRHDEVAAIDAWVASLPRGPSTLLIEGEAGIGKTTLWSAGVEAARARSCRVLAAMPSAAETMLSFAAVTDLLEPDLDALLPRLPPPQRRALEFALLREEAAGAPPDERAIAVAFLGSLRALAPLGPVVVAIDDVQWLDRPSAAVLAFAMRRVRGEPVGFLLAERVEDRAPARDEAGVRRMPVAPLGLGAVHRLLHERLGTSFARPTIRRVHEVSGGNPFFALELGRALLRGGVDSASAAPLTVPPTLLELVHQRLAALPPDTQAALQVTAALSQPTLDVLAAASPGARGALDAAAQALVVEIDRDEVRFAHPLLAAGAYASIPPSRRLALHARLAQLAGDPEARARHLGLATTGTDAAVAAELEQAARRARGRGAPTSAAELAEEARRHTPADQVGARLRRACDAGRYRFEAGDTAGARRLLEEALERAPGGRPRAALRVMLGRVHLYEGDEVLAGALLHDALEEAGDDLALRSEAEQALSTAHLFRRHDLAAGARHARTAVRIAERLGEVRALGVALGQLGVVEGLRGSAAATPAFERALALPDAGYRMAIQEPAYVYCDYLAWADRYGEARGRLDAAYARALADGDESSLAVILGDIGLVECVRGRWDEAARAIEEGREVAVQTGQRPWQAYVLGVRALLGAHLGRVEETRADARRALELAGEGAMVARICATSGLGLLALSLDDPAGAYGELGPLAGRLAEAGVEEPGDTRFVPVAVEALVRLGRNEEGRRLLDRFEGQAARLRRAGALAASLRCRGLLAAAEGDPQSALTFLERSLAAYDRVEQPFERARTLLELGCALRRLRRRRRARERLTEARAAFEALGAQIWAGCASDELGRIGGRAAAGGDLTPAEQRVAALVAEGRTNHEVATALFVADRTVEFHLSHIYAKLGLRSRSELVRRIGGKD